MKLLVTKLAAAFALAALATPALPCGTEKTTTTAEKSDKKAEKPVAAPVQKDGKATQVAAQTPRSDDVKASSAKPSK